MPVINYLYTVTYENGRTRSSRASATQTIEVTDEDYLTIVKGVAGGKSLSEIAGIDSVLSSMRAHVVDDDSYMGLNGSYRNKKLREPRRIQGIELFLEDGFVRRIMSLSDPIAEMTRPEQVMTVYRSDGSSVEIHYRRGEIMYIDSKKKGQHSIMTADTFLNWFVR